ncbi:hypothetical protein M0765_000720 [Variovorax sp. S2]|uniref:hypothetical protein n=1 Tax=Variovorax sp. S12S4 TaxID=3029170 RepID=UPI00215D47D0|nr:hypothetical protein [Variovorax sp. S12S4]MCR8956302.1 hypothetical protein [Variovorax sp. S12S4]
MNAHRLNHHDIQTIRAFEDRAKKKACDNLRVDCITLLGCLLALLALLVLGLIAGLPQ